MTSIRCSLAIRYLLTFFLTFACLLAPVVQSRGFVYKGSRNRPALNNADFFNYFPTGDLANSSENSDLFTLFPGTRFSAQNNLTGQLWGTQTTPQTNVNLTTEGAADWAHWGLTDSTSFNHKNGVVPQISNYTAVGSGGVQRYSTNPNLYSWSGGTPSSSATNTPTGVYITGLNNGFQLTVPADTVPRVLKLFVGVWAAGGKLEAALSDGSAPDFVDTSLVNQTGTSNAIYTLNFQAGTAGQTLTVKWTVSSIFQSFGNVTLQAASVSEISDNSLPTVKFEGLRHYLRVSNQIPVTVQATDNTGISRVEFYLDGNLINTSNVVPNTTNASVTFDWNTAAATNGKHILQAKAFDTTGNSQSANLMIVTRNTEDQTQPLPTATFTATPATIFTGQPAILSWTTTDAQTVTINQGIGSVALNSSVTVSPSATTTYTLTASNTAGSVTKTATVTVNPLTGNTILLNPTVRYQTMRGWEATGEAAQLYSPAWNNYKNSLLDQAVNDLGLNRVRLEIKSGIENPTDYFAQWRAGQITESQYNAKRYEIINDDANPNTINSNGFKWSQIDSTIDNLILPIRQRLQARGESLWINVDYIDFGASTFEHKNTPAEYAEFVLATYQHMQTKYGFVPDSWEIVLEPDTSTANWSAAQVAQVIKAAGDRLAANGFVPRFVAPSTTNASNAPTYIDQIAQTTGAMPFVDEFSYHRYAGATSSVIQTIANRAATYGKQTAMLEWIGADYNTLHEDLKLGRNSSWQQFVLAGLASWGSDGGGALYIVDDTVTTNPTITMGSRTKFLRQYFKFIRSGAQRIEALTGNANFDPLAFTNTNGKYVVVVKASTNGSFNVQNLPAGTYGIKYTTAAQYNIDLPDVVIGAGQQLTTSIPAAGVLTIYAK
jgi:hypothetical protein